MQLLGLQIETTAVLGNKNCKEVRSMEAYGWSVDNQFTHHTKSLGVLTFTILVRVVAAGHICTGKGATILQLQEAQE
jgi:hypothetical protein